MKLKQLKPGSFGVDHFRIAGAESVQSELLMFVCDLIDRDKILCVCASPRSSVAVQVKSFTWIRHAFE